MAQSVANFLCKHNHKLVHTYCYSDIQNTSLYTCKKLSSFFIVADIVQSFFSKLVIKLYILFDNNSNKLTIMKIFR